MNKGEHEGAHRFAWKLAFGPIPKGMNVEQTCEQRRCVNPEHLMLKPRGAKLTAEDVHKIRRLYATGAYTYGRLSRRFRVGPEEIGMIVCGETWQEVEQADSQIPS